MSVYSDRWISASLDLRRTHFIGCRFAASLILSSNVWCIPMSSAASHSVPVPLTSTVGCRQVGSQTCGSEHRSLCWSTDVCQISTEVLRDTDVHWLQGIGFNTNVARTTIRDDSVERIIGGNLVAQDERESSAPKQSTESPKQDVVETSKPISGTTVRGAENAPLSEEISPKLEEAVQRGFESLRRMQKADGSFGQGRFGEHVGITSLCAIALMADGNVPGRGEFGDCVQKALDFVLSHSTETGLIVSDDTHGPMYGHGFATLFLGEIYGMNQDDDRVRDALVRAVQLIVSSQNDEGGWRYNPVPADADVSVTICEIMALRSARNAGIKVPKSTIDDAIRYVRSCQNDDGGFRYMKEVSGSLWPRTAAGIASLFYAGVYEDESIDRGLDYLTRNAFPRAAGGAGMGFSQQHYFYGHYYAVQAMYLAGGERWKNWWPAIREELISKQNTDGTWTDQQIGDAYGTAMALIVLQMPKRYLPIFQR